MPAARRAGLRFLDRIALLRVPARSVALASIAASSECSSALGRSVVVHDDLLLFTRRPAPGTTACARETSDD
ncbi:hypothetical protein [Allokutzneria sp. NRRL B-24872]|uniref:hypothetical protein n=1 Tax=Allokutzneria sp. NRRL B-24872 TaxID=1137961 RepID=UPI000A3CA8B0|nr:hypothetical protein [Allokutzneria sp. NRRL B-24872]